MPRELPHGCPSAVLLGGAEQTATGPWLLGQCPVSQGPVLREPLPQLGSHHLSTYSHS